MCVLGGEERQLWRAHRKPAQKVGGDNPDREKGAMEQVAEEGGWLLSVHAVLLSRITHTVSLTKEAKGPPETHPLDLP